MRPYRRFSSGTPQRGRDSRPWIIRWSLPIGLLALAFAACARNDDGRAILAKIRPGHPRLMMTVDTIGNIKAAVSSDPWIRRRYRAEKARADQFLAQPVSVAEFKGGDGMVDTSRQVLERVTTLALVYRIGGDRRYLDRAWSELEAAARFRSWGLRPFLSTAEMTAAFALAYDWLYDDWNEDRRQALRRAILELGLRPGLEAYSSQRWPLQPDNHNIVDNGGLALGALALGNEDPGICGRILALGLASAPRCLAQFSPDGAWPEGPMYWGYEMEYASMYLASLETACGTDFGLGDIPGVGAGGWFPLYVNGPAGGPFNFGDAPEDRETRSGPPLLWLAARFHEPRYAQYEIEHPNGRMSVLDLVWGAGAGHEPWQTIPPDRYFRGVELATMRDRWGDARAWFVGLKAGSKDASHNHLDLGTFVLEAKGVRWAVDLGGDDPDLPGYSHDDGDGRRWTYYRLRAEGHNTLVIDPGPGPDQSYRASGKITSFQSTPRGVELAADLTPAYPAAARIVRRLLFVRNQGVTINDTIELKQAGEIWWFLQTRASVASSPDGRALILRQAGETLRVSLLQPVSARFETGPAAPLPTSPHPSRQGENPGVTRIAIHLARTQQAAIAVRFEP
jgi:hypothetical protein